MKSYGYFTEDKFQEDDTFITILTGIKKFR